MKTSLAISFLITIGFIAPLRAQGPVFSQKSVTNGNTISTTTFSSPVASGFGGAQMPDFERMFEEFQSTTQAAMNEAMAGAGHGLGGAGTFTTASTGRRTAAPELLVSRPLDAAKRAEWTEDLRVMDKLLRDVVSRAESDAPRHAMGIRIWLTNRPQTPPQLLDDLAVVFCYEINFPLAPSGNASPPAGRETNATSAWERARRELQGGARTNAPLRRTHAAPAAEFESARVEELIDALAGAMTQARNIRHLSPGAAVVVTVSGADEAGNPLRLTLRATRRDLDKLTDATPAQARKSLAWSLQ